MIDLDINFFDLYMLKEFKTFDDFKKLFKTELKCIKYLIDLRFKGVLTCPRCGCNKCYKLKQQGLFKCSACNKPFTMKVGTIFEDSALPLTKWFEAFYWEVITVKGVSSHQLAKHLGITQKTAWFMLQRIRWALANNTIEKMKGDIQIDETYVGGKEINKHKNKKMPLSQGGNHKMSVLGILQTGGKVAMQYIRKSNINNIKPVLARYVDLENSILNTDESPLYKGYKRNVVNHSKKQYKNGSATTNGIESVFSHFKRMVLGVFMHISRKHINVYLNAFSFRFNTRELSSFDKFNSAMGLMFSKRLMYVDLINN